jgi:hypothetical protein
VTRLRQGDLVNPTWSRTPLAIRYDPSAARVLDAAIRRYSDRTAGDDWHPAWVASPAGDPVDKGGLTAHERAFTQALNYDKRVYRHGTPRYVTDPATGDRVDNPNPYREWSVKTVWTGERGARGRKVRVRVFPVGEASLHAQRQGAG